MIKQRIHCSSVVITYVWHLVIQNYKTFAQPLITTNYLKTTVDIPVQCISISIYITRGTDDNRKVVWVCCQTDHKRHLHMLSARLLELHSACVISCNVIACWLGQQNWGGGRRQVLGWHHGDWDTCNNPTFRFGSHQGVGHQGVTRYLTVYLLYCIVGIYYTASL